MGSIGRDVVELTTPVTTHSHAHISADYD